MTYVPNSNSIGWKLAELAHFEIFGWLGRSAWVKLETEFGFKADSHNKSPYKNFELLPQSVLELSYRE